MLTSLTMLFSLVIVTLNVLFCLSQLIYVNFVFVYCTDLLAVVLKSLIACMMFCVILMYHCFPTLRSGSSPSPTRQRAGHIACTKLPCLHEIFKYAHLKFTVYGRKDTHTFANAVTLVWGSLRLAPTNYSSFPSSFEAWNSLHFDVANKNSLLSFKHVLCN